MCGIAGIIGDDARSTRDAVCRMNYSQIHRGPDGEGLEVVSFGGDKHVGLSHRRLSIIDLSPMGAQPIVHPESGDVLVYNGEIYNFRELRRQLKSEGIQFRGHSDTEVLLHALTMWGTRVFDYIEGMYAFAYLDRLNRTLLLGRDPLGIKPLYYSFQNYRLIFASEVRAIVASGLVNADISARAVQSFLAYGAVQGPDTIVDGVVSLPPGSFLKVSIDNMDKREIIRFWDFPEPDGAMSSSNLAEEIRDVLGNAVESHLVSDVPVGVFLSSGLDSSTVATLAAQRAGNVRTFTVGFEEHDEISEVDVASHTAEQLQTSHQNIMVSMQESLDWTNRWLRDMDQPSMDGFNVYIISKAVKGAGITVALSGQGGDELFGGYSSFEYVPRFYSLHNLCRLMPKRVRKSMAVLATIGKPLSAREKAVDMMNSNGSLTSLYLRRRRTMSDSQMQALGLVPCAVGLNEDYMLPEEVDGRSLTFKDPIAAVSVLESRFYLGNMLLRDGDCFGMAHSLEIRVPFLDRRVIDLLYRIPGHIRLPDGRANKHLLRQAMNGHLTTEVLGHRKKGFMLPIADWMAGPLKDICRDSLYDLKLSGVVDPSGVDTVWNAFCREPRSPIWSRAWEMCVLGHYLRNHQEAQAVSSCAASN